MSRIGSKNTLTMQGAKPCVSLKPSLKPRIPRPTDVNKQGSHDAPNSHMIYVPNNIGGSTNVFLL